MWVHDPLCSYFIVRRLLLQNSDTCSKYTVALFAFITTDMNKAKNYILHIGVPCISVDVKKETSCYAGKHLIIHVLEAETDSLVKRCWGNVSQQPSDSPGIVSLDTVSGMCSLISRPGQADTWWEGLAVHSLLSGLVGWMIKTAWWAAL